jgi:hypothetical protein
MAKTPVGDDEIRDFDETRRLAYMALLANRTKKYNLAGTLVNALVHHHAVELDAAEVTDHVVRVIENDDADGRAWLQAQIDRVSAELGD